MIIKKNRYLQNFIVACSSGIGFAIVFLAFGLNIFTSVSDTIRWLLILIGFSVYLILLKLIFNWIKISDLIDGVWIGIVLYCWSPIVTLAWKENLINSLKGASIYFIVGLGILLLGYSLRKQKQPQ